MKIRESNSYLAAQTLYSALIHSVYRTRVCDTLLSLPFPCVWSCYLLISGISYLKWRGEDIFVYFCICAFVYLYNYLTVYDRACISYLGWRGAYVFAYLLSCICVFIFLYLCICICVTVFVRPSLLSVAIWHLLSGMEGSSPPAPVSDARVVGGWGEEENLDSRFQCLDSRKYWAYQMHGS